MSLLVAFALLVGLPAVASANPAAEATLKSKQAELTGLLKKGKSADSDKKMATIFDALLDYETLAKKSLGSHWDDLSDAERKEFQDVLKRLVRNAYRKNLKKTADYDVKYKGSNPAKQGVVVHTVAKSKSNTRDEPISIDYAMHKVDGKWEVYDLVTEGSSLVNNYKSQFGRVIKKKGFAELMRRMKKKLDKEGA
jgi:phospholipid transport system substrate-binding protein